MKPGSTAIAAAAFSSSDCPHVIAATETHGGAGGGEEGDKSSVRSEVKKQLRLACPLVAGCLLQYVVQMVSVMFVGHLGKVELAGAAVATSFAGVTGFSLLVNIPWCPRASLVSNVRATGLTARRVVHARQASHAAWTRCAGRPSARGGTTCSASTSSAPCWCSRW